MSIVLLALVALLVGTLIGCVGVGGILLIPALAAFSGLTTHMSMATALFSFIFTGIVGTLLYQRKGSIDWRITIPVCLGAVFFGYLGAMVNSHLNAVYLNIALACIIIFAGIYTYRPYTGKGLMAAEGDSGGKRVALFAIGAAVGFGSGLTGVGGPVLSVPMMVILGFSPLTAIATSQVIQIVAAVSGTIGNLKFGGIDFTTGMWVTAVELVGVAIGAYIAHCSGAKRLRTIVAVVCIVVGGFILLKSLIALA
ncbi:sulfite exporter TauE/SafE family protein [Desulfocurvibacter africanus]|uniref:sulfite exporter TauE/SafE family protein n=1 Tax=Desulfocurvibacter africanus TaxID=873 RepID=UPI002FDB1CBF